MKKKFTEEQMTFLATQERDMRTAVESNWSRYPGQANIEQMRKIWEELTGQTREIRLSCSSCILNLVRDMGVLYFAQKAEAEAEKKAADEPQTPAPAETAEKAPVNDAKGAEPTTEPTKPQKPAKGAKTSKGKK